MCGIAGFLRIDGEPVEQSSVRMMADSIRHRGPDDEGYLFVNTHTGDFLPIGGPDTPRKVFSSDYLYSPKNIINDFPVKDHYNLALANRRLAIIDLSPAGHQPICNEDATVWVVHNGEIYNFREIREELKTLGHRFVSDTDTEVIAHAYEQWGAKCVERFNGMWAFCAWDAKKQKLFCSRDRFGIKPFYYYFDGKRFLFASEIKALLQANIPRKPNDKLIYDYLFSGSIDRTEETFFEGIKQLRGGEYLELQLETGKLEIKRYWNIDPSKKLLGLSDKEYAQRFYELLEDSVRLRLISDVPVGSCLSGGLDSSTIVCLVDRLMREKGVKIPGSDIQKTFSARYKDTRHDEGDFIEAVVRKTHVDARFIYPTGEKLLEEMERLIYHQDEPFGSTSIYAQWNVFRLARETGVKVTLDGQGADEMLAGYNGFYRAYLSSLLKSLRLIRFWKELTSIPKSRLSLQEAFYGAIAFMLPPRVRNSLGWIKRTGKLPTSWLNPQFVASYHQRVNPNPKDLDEALLRALTQRGLPSLLRYEDRNSMAHSIESRVPFLDYRLVEFVFSLPLEQKISRGINKVVLRNATEGLIPEIVRRRTDKIGFSTPEDLWFRTTMKDFIQQLISSESFRSRPYFNADQVEELFKVHLRGERNLSILLWRIINLELWLRQFID